MKVDHTLNPADFADSAFVPDALQRLHSGDWAGFEIRDLRTAFGALYHALRETARKSKLKAADPRCTEIRRCLHTLGDIFAAKWLEQGEKVFLEKLDFYQRKARVERAYATDELFYQALLRLDQSRQRAGSHGA